ncbi:porphobilinogen deaminase HemC [Methanobrevibacter ruminantium M1]|uniref:Probable porphobilinogen deaminase n=1 Tax=Methanobrevibacter ruminantium (strain ATCC 35063 / DSM 1093 / JCM 13430 / OCM 146 / M1) TaxID=634498 RepID=D3DZ46_METRM|nr:hydroxymethylbilane synthase [Methanobrevibacter ruminantium]ADC47596.1 porphobilinogen deaminase HemC [Methanobrevibacter ruminantium M1]
MIVGTRGSKLALVQTDYIRQCLYNITGEEVEKNIIKTKGDKITNSQLYNMDSKGLFTRELDNALLDEEVDFAVHSLKDVPTELNEDLEIVAVPIRESPNEVLISNYSWSELEEGSTLGTSSLRREAFCKHHNKDFELKPIRGNVETRIEKVMDGQVDATIMAEAGLNRLGLQKYIKAKFPTDYIMPAAGQGALAVMTRKDSEHKETIRKLNHYFSHQEVLAEKTILEEIGVGCQWPIGAISGIKNNQLELKSILLDKNGEILYQKTLSGSIREAKEMGVQIGKEMIEFI